MDFHVFEHNIKYKSIKMKASIFGTLNNKMYNERYYNY